jgi:hypothetical protein
VRPQRRRAGAGHDWHPSWGGALELWYEQRTRCEASYLPVLERLIVMDHGDAYWHGHPTPLACPEGCFRASVWAGPFRAVSAATPGVFLEDIHACPWGGRRRILREAQDRAALAGAG